MRQMKNEEGIPAILFSKGGQLQKFIISANETQLLLTPAAKQQKVITYDLHKLHVVSLQMEDEDIELSSSSQAMLFQMMIKRGKQFRCLNFCSLAEMNEAMSFILEKQKLQPQRLQQYKLLHKIDLRCVVGESSVVEHRLTKEKFVLKTLSKTSSALAVDMMRREIDVLKACREQKYAVKIEDVIEEEQHITVIMQHFEQKSLREVVELGAEIDLLDVLQMIKDIAKMIKSLH